MIMPDTKDWTWVLERACLECGFDASVCSASEVARLVRENATAWRLLLEDGSIRPGRLDDSKWSSLEYACHVRDVYRRYKARIDLMLDEDDPLFANWDQDRSALEDRYEEQDPVVAVTDLVASAEVLAAELDGLSEAAWVRPGRRGDGASFTVDTISRYMAHDPIHHLWDVTNSRP
jgi:hypothetical protein